jgi:hypothetical protein
VDHTKHTTSSIGQFEGIIKANNETMMYTPPLKASKFWNLKADMIPINDTLSEVTFFMTFNTIGIYKYSMYNQFELAETQTIAGMQTGGEMNNFKIMLRDTNFYVLVITAIVSVLHTIFEFMAMKSDVEFWRGRESLRGLSTKLLMFNFLASIVTFLFLLD